MTDSIAVLPPGWRALDNNGSIITQATLYFYDTDGVTPKTVYSDPDLEDALGTSVSCNSGGYPVSGGGTRVIVYVGSSPYNVLLKDSAGTTVWSHENVRGALDTSAFVTSGGLVASSPVVTVAGNTTRTVADAGKVISGNTTGSDVTTTLPSAVVAGNGFRIGVRHGGTANEHHIASTAGSFYGILGSNAAVSTWTLYQPGETMWFVSNGSDWVLDSHHTYDPWLNHPIGVPIPVWTNLTGVTVPPTDRKYRYILLTAGEDGTGEYNNGVLASESVSGSSPYINATAVVNDDDSPIDGVTVRLINSERRFLRAGSSGTLQDDEFKAHTHSYSRPDSDTGGGSGVPDVKSRSSQQTGSTGGDETRPRNIGINYYMRIR